MTDMTLEQMAAKIRSHADFVGSLGGSGELMDSVELSDIADAIDAHLAKAAQPAAVGDNWPYGVGIYGPANMPEPQPITALIPEDAQGCDPRAKTSYRYGYQHGWKAAREYAALAHPRPTVPDGYRLVPVEPTEAMLVEGRNENLCCADDSDRIYAAMLAAAPDGEVG